MDTPLVPMRPVPLQATGLQIAAPPEEHHPVFILRGFLNRVLDEAYTASTENTIGGRPIYWSSNRSHFVYFQRAEMRWVISPRYNGEGNMDLLAHVLRGEMRGVAFEGGGNTWQEFYNGGWHPVTIQFTKLVAEKQAVAKQVNSLPTPSSSSTGVGRTYNIDRNKRPALSSIGQQGGLSRQAAKDGVAIVVCDGFNTQALNTTYKVDRALVIGGRSTYWDSTQTYFMYYQLSQKRWAISCKNAGGEDLLLDAQRGGIRGFAYEADKEQGGTKWREYFRDSWLTLEPRVQKLTAAGELSSLAPAPKILVPQTRPREAPAPKARPQEPIVAIKVEDATPSIPERSFQESCTPVPTQPLASLASQCGSPKRSAAAPRNRPAEQCKPIVNDKSQVGASQKEATPHNDPTEPLPTEPLPDASDSTDESDEDQIATKQAKMEKEAAEEPIKDSSDESEEARKAKKKQKKDSVVAKDPPDEPDVPQKVKKKEKKDPGGKNSSDEADDAKKAKKQEKQNKKDPAVVKDSLDEPDETQKAKKMQNKDAKDSSDEPNEPQKVKRKEKKDPGGKGSSDESDDPKKTKKHGKKEKKDIAVAKESSDESGERRKTKKQEKKDKKHKKDKKEKKQRREKKMEERLRRELRKELQEKMKRKAGSFSQRNNRAKEDGRSSKEAKTEEKCTKVPLKSRRKAAKQPPSDADAPMKIDQHVKRKRKRLDTALRSRKCWAKEITDSWPADESELI